MRTLVRSRCIPRRQPGIRPADSVGAHTSGYTGSVTYSHAPARPASRQAHHRRLYDEPATADTRCSPVREPRDSSTQSISSLMSKDAGGDNSS